VAEAHQAEAPRVGRGFVYGRGGRFIARGRAAAVFGHGYAGNTKVLARLVVPRVSVAALEEAGGIEGAAAVEVSLAAARPERLHWHCCARG
jgi:hypothetical protein